LVIVPGQFLATTEADRTTGIHRRYTELAFDVYHAPYDATDFQPPTIWAAEALESVDGIRFRISVEDDSGAVMRVVLLYRDPGERTWSMLELSFNPETGRAEGHVPGLKGPIYYFAQAVDASGNVALALDHGLAFVEVKSALQSIYLPAVFQGHP
jgi:hypothetical protein